MKSNFSKNPDVQALCEDAYGLGERDTMSMVMRECRQALAEGLNENQALQRVLAKFQAAIDARKE